MSLHVCLVELLTEHEPLATSQRRLAGRTSLIFGLCRGASGFGEATPLPGFGPPGETWETARSELLAVAPACARILQRHAGAWPTSPLPCLHELGELVASPSARHAVETALLALWSAETQRPWWPLFCDTLRSGTTLPTGHVLDPLSARAPQELTTLLDAGVRTLKLKVGRARDAELSFVEQLAQARVPLSLRLDPNGAWTRAEAVAFLDRTCALLAGSLAELEWVEDPTSDLQDWAELRTRCPVALDEPLARLPLGAPEATLDRALDAADVAILKPMALGGPVQTSRLAERARARGLEVSLSHLFDGPLAWRAAAELAFALQTPSIAPGLGAHRALDGWREREDSALRVLLAPPLSVSPLAAARAALPSAHAAEPFPALRRPLPRDELGLMRSSRADPEAPALILQGPGGDFSPLSYRSLWGSLPPPTSGVWRSLLATPQPETIAELLSALLAGVPTLLLHPLSTPAERQALEARVHAASSRLRPDDALILATSGTSGRPHLVVHTRASLSSAVLASRSHLGAPHAADRWLLSLPFAHVGGLAVLLRAFSAGASVVLAPLPKTPAEVARLLVTSGTTLLSLVPTQLARLLAEPGFRFPEAVRMVLVGGAATPQSLRDLALARGVPLATTYGLTEMGSQVATHPVPALAGGRRGVGTALPGIDLRCGETRRLLVRGPMCMRCYLDEPTPQDGAGWLQTGDLAELLEDGCLEILGRADHLIVTGGENVSPQTVEAALVQTGLLTEACVVGLPDPVWGERVVAAVVCPGQENSASQGVLVQLEQDLRRRLEGAIARYALPKEFFWFPCLPRLPSGKIDRLAVLEAIRTPAASN